MFVTGCSCLVPVRWGHITERRQVRGGDGGVGGGGKGLFSTLRRNLKQQDSLLLLLFTSFYNFRCTNKITGTRSNEPPPPRSSSSSTCHKLSYGNSRSLGMLRRLATTITNKCLKDTTKSAAAHWPTFWFANGGVDLHHALYSHYFASNRDGIATHNAVTMATDLEQSCWWFFFVVVFFS